MEMRLGHGVEHLLVPRLPCEGLFGAHEVCLRHHIFNFLWVETFMATLPLVVLDVEVINHVLGRHPHLVLGRRQRERFLDLTSFSESRWHLSKVSQLLDKLFTLKKVNYR